MVTSRHITYSADDRTLIGTLVLPDGDDQRPGVLVCHEGPGLDVLLAEPRTDATNVASIGYCFGGTMTFEEEMRAGDVDWQLQVYGGAQHSFTRPGAEKTGIPGIAYHEPTDRRSWQAMLNLFDEVFA